MNHLIVSFVLVFVASAMLTTSTPLGLQNRQDSDSDSLSGFKPCYGVFPNNITTYSYEPIPVVSGQNVTMYWGGEATVVVEQGVIMRIIGYDENNNERLLRKIGRAHV